MEPLFITNYSPFHLALIFTLYRIVNQIGEIPALWCAFTIDIDQGVTFIHTMDAETWIEPTSITPDGLIELNSMNADHIRFIILSDKQLDNAFDIHPLKGSLERDRAFKRFTRSLHNRDVRLSTF